MRILPVKVYFGYKSWKLKDVYRTAYWIWWVYAYRYCAKVHGVKNSLISQNSSNPTNPWMEWIGIYVFDLASIQQDVGWLVTGVHVLCGLVSDRDVCIRSTEDWEDLVKIDRHSTASKADICGVIWDLWTGNSTRKLRFYGLSDSLLLIVSVLVRFINLLHLGYAR